MLTKPVWGCIATAVLFLGTAAHATPIRNVRTETNTDWTSAGIAGVGGGSGTIQLSGVNGSVRRAFLYWHGIDRTDFGGDGAYDNETVAINGNSVTGVSLGNAPTNCWGSGASRAFRADVTPFVGGNGNYMITGLSAKAGHSANGASLVVVYDDGNPANNRDLVFFEGNDSNNTENFPGEDNGWNATLSGINYGGGQVGAQLHVADGQDFGDNTLIFSSGAGMVTINDTVGLWDGTSIPSAGTSRAGNGALFDIHNST
jgi:hypothetical protein